MLPKSIEDCIQAIKNLPGIGKRSAQKLTLDILQQKQNEFELLQKAITTMRNSIKFCKNCGFFCEVGSTKDSICEICIRAFEGNRNKNKICLVLDPTDVLNLEKTQIYNGTYHVLENLISPIDNIFAEDTTLGDLLSRRIPELIKQIEKTDEKIEIILFLKPSFSTDTTIAYITDWIYKNNWQNQILITKLAEGLPLYYNPDNLDQATMIKALEDRRPIN